MFCFERDHLQILDAVMSIFQYLQAFEHPNTNLTTIQPSE